MDKINLIQTVQKIVESRDVFQQRKLEMEQTLKNYEDYCNSLEEETKCFEEETVLNKEILAIYNYTKTVFKEHSVIIKGLFGSLYSWLQDIIEKINTIADPKSNLLENSYQECENICNQLKMDYKNKEQLKLNEERATIQKLETENSDICNEKQRLKEKLAALILCGENLQDEIDEKSKCLDALEMELEIYSDQAEREQLEFTAHLKSLQDKDLSNKNEISELEQTIQQAKENISGVKRNIQQNKSKINECIATKNQNELKKVALEKEIAELNKQCALIDDLSRKNIETEYTTKENNLEKEVDMTQQKISDTINKIGIFEEINIKLEEQKTQMQLRYEANKEEVKKMESLLKDEKKEFESLEQKIKKIAEDSKEVDSKYEEIQKHVKSLKEEIDKEENVLKELRSKEQEELLSIDNKTEILRVEVGYQKKSKIEEIQKIENVNRSLQQNIEEVEQQTEKIHQKTEELKIQNESSKNVMKQLDLQYESACMELKKLELSKQKNKNIIPNPPLKKPISSRPVSAQPVKRSIKLDDSGSSVDGETLSYKEFMARKTLKESRKQKRAAKKQ